jgi:hypothetical protein
MEYEIKPIDQNINGKEYKLFKQEDILNLMQLIELQVSAYDFVTDQDRIKIFIGNWTFLKEQIAQKENNK